MMAQAAQLARDARRDGRSRDLLRLPANWTRRRSVGAGRGRRSTSSGRASSWRSSQLISATYEPTSTPWSPPCRVSSSSRALPANGQSTVERRSGNALSVPATCTAAFTARWIGRTGSAAGVLGRRARRIRTLGAAADDLETTLRLDMLFDGFAPALADLRTQRQARHHQVDARSRALAGRRLADVSRSGRHSRRHSPALHPAVKAAAYARRCGRRARAVFPTEYPARTRRGHPAPIATKFVPILAAANPELDLTRPLPDAPKWGTIATADQPAARAEWRLPAGGAHLSCARPRALLLDAVAGRRHQSDPRRGQSRARGVDDLISSTRRSISIRRQSKALDIVDARCAGRWSPTSRACSACCASPAPSGGRIAARRRTRLGYANRARASRSEFVERYGSLLGGDTAAHGAYSAAFQIATTAQLALTTTAQSMAGASPWAVRGGSTTTFAAPDYSAVFGLLQKTAGRVRRNGDMAHPIPTRSVVRLRRVSVDLWAGRVLRRSAPHARP